LQMSWTTSFGMSSSMANSCSAEMKTYVYVLDTIIWEERNCPWIPSEVWQDIVLGLVSRSMLSNWIMA